MTFKRLAKPVAKTLNNFASSDVSSGNNPCNGNGTSKGTVYVNWPYDPASMKDGSLTKPPQNEVVPPRLQGGNNLKTGMANGDT